MIPLKVIAAILVSVTLILVCSLGIALLLTRGPVSPRLTCAEIERVLPAIAAANSSSLGQVHCTRVRQTAADAYTVDAELTQGSERKLWTFRVVADSWLVTDGKQTGSKTVHQPSPA